MRYKLDCFLTLITKMVKKLYYLNFAAKLLYAILTFHFDCILIGVFTTNWNKLQCFYLEYH